DGTGTAATFNTPTGITIDTAHANLYVVDQGNNKIRQIVISSGAVTSLTLVPGPFNPGLNGPQGITTDGINLYVTDNGSYIRQIVISTGALTTLAGQNGVLAATDGTNARFNNPQ